MMMMMMSKKWSGCGWTSRTGCYSYVIVCLMVVESDTAKFSACSCSVKCLNQYNMYTVAFAAAKSTATEDEPIFVSGMYVGCLWWVTIVYV